jgi:hypothetical protein
MIRFLTKYCTGYQIEKTGMGGTCGTYGGREKLNKNFGEET